MTPAIIKVRLLELKTEATKLGLEYSKTKMGIKLTDFVQQIEPFVEIETAIDKAINKIN